MGHEVEIIGVADPGGYAPVIRPTKIQILGKRPLPTAKPVGIERLLTGSEDSQRVEVQGVIQSVVADPIDGQGRRMIRVRGQRGSFMVLVSPAKRNEPDRMVDAEVRVRGLMMSLFNTRGEITGARVAVRSEEDLIIDKPPVEDPFLAPRVKIGGILLFNSTAPPIHRQVVEGVVTYRVADHLYIEGSDHGVRVTGWQGDAIEPGDKVLVSAFVEADRGVATLANAVVRKLEYVGLPEPLRMTPELMLRADINHAWAGWEGLPADHNGRRVQFDALLKDVQHEADNHQIVHSFFVQAGNRSIEVYFADGRNFTEQLLRPGCLLRLTGIAAMQYSSNSLVPEFLRPDNIELYSLGVQDIELLTPAPYWTNERLGYGVLAASTLASILGIWSWLLWRHVHKQTQSLEREQALHREMEIERQITQRERHRLSGDLHDSLQQSLAGLSFQLEAADGALQYGISVEKHLTPARQLLLHLREEFRETVLALRHLETDQEDIELALSRVAAVQRMCGPAEIEVEMQGEPESLPRTLVNAFVLITQEAIVNATQHGLATQITITVAFNPDKVCLSVTDNGKGFSAKTLEERPPEAGHHGMTTMTERMSRLGAELEIKSMLENGTSVRACVTRQIIERLLHTENQQAHSPEVITTTLL